MLKWYHNIHLLVLSESLYKVLFLLMPLYAYGISSASTHWQNAEIKRILARTLFRCLHGVISISHITERSLKTICMSNFCHTNFENVLIPEIFLGIKQMNICIYFMDEW